MITEGAIKTNVKEIPKHSKRPPPPAPIPQLINRGVRKGRFNEMRCDFCTCNSCNTDEIAQERGY